MITKLKEVHRHDLLEFLGFDPIVNCYLISDVMVFGLESENLAVYGEYQNFILVSVLAVFKRYGICYTNQKQVSEEYLEVVKKEKPVSISGEKESLESFLAVIPYDSIKEYSLAELGSLEVVYEEKDYHSITRLQSNTDIRKLYDLLVQINEFNVSTQSFEEFLDEKKLLHQSGNTYGILLDNHLVSTVAVISETDTHAVVNGVATKKEYRNKGLAKELMKHVIYEYIEKKEKKLLLYFDNPVAEKIYLNYGFKPVAIWASSHISDIGGYDGE